MESLQTVAINVLTRIMGQIPWMIGLAAFFTLLSVFRSQACNPDRPWWKSRDLLTDAQYFFIMPIITPYAKLFTLILAVAALRGVMSEADVDDYINNGRGPVSHWPVWAQFAFYMLGTDFILYWAHRVFHKFPLWPFHAVHHSSLDVDWTTTYRSHPINQMLSSGLASTIMIVAGVPPWIMIWLVPFDTITAAWVHANLNWTLGPLQYLFATPVFHRWHHTHTSEGGDKNFSSTFAIWDLMFGTYYMPKGKLPTVYGVDDELFPHDWAHQMVVPFKQFFEHIQRPPANPEAKSSIKG